MKITVGQFNVQSKQVKANYLAMKRLIDKALENDFEVIVFGEFALSGYGCGDLFLNIDFIREVYYYQTKLKELAQNITIIFGGLLFVEDSLYNTAIVYSKDQSDYSFKDNLSKREFLEYEYFNSNENNVIDINGKKTLVTFKSDLDNIQNYTYDNLIVLDSSPVNNYPDIVSDKQIVYANTTGVTAVNKVVFINGGNSYIKNNEKIYSFKQGLDTGIIVNNEKIKTLSKLYSITTAIKIWSDQTFGKDKKWIVGSSGGLDSAVTTALLAIALGSENVITYNLASKYNKDITISNARTISKKLKVKHYENSIQALVDEAKDTLNEFGYDEIDSLAFENIQARTRGHMLSAFSSLENAVIANNSNKLELVLGYATMYGDTIGALSLIGDLTKVEVFELADEINKFLDDEVIMENLLPKVKDYTVEWQVAPSAELKEDQLDPMKWFYHDLLLDLMLTHSSEEIFESYLTDQFKGMEISKWLDFYDLLDGQAFIDDFNWFSRTIQINHFKRLQTPPVLAYGNRVIGVDYKESPNVLAKSQLYESLETKISKKY